MQTGSLVTPRSDINNIWISHINGRRDHPYRPLKKGEILTVDSVECGYDNFGSIVTGITLVELGVQINSNGGIFLWDASKFDELQPPMTISDELFSHAPETCEA